MERKDKLKRLYRFRQIRYLLGVSFVLCFFDANAQNLSDTALFEYVIKYMADSADRIEFVGIRNDTCKPNLKEFKFNFKPYDGDTLDTYYDLSNLSSIFPNGEYDSQTTFGIEAFYRISKKIKAENRFFCGANRSFEISPVYKRGDNQVIFTVFREKARGIEWMLYFVFTEYKFNRIETLILLS